jgi:hypothetical protein
VGKVARVFGRWPLRRLNISLISEVAEARRSELLLVSGPVPMVFSGEELGSAGSGSSSFDVYRGAPSK